MYIVANGTIERTFFHYVLRWWLIISIILWQYNKVDTKHIATFINRKELAVNKTYQCKTNWLLLKIIESFSWKLLLIASSDLVLKILGSASSLVDTLWIPAHCLGSKGMIPLHGIILWFAFRRRAHPSNMASHGIACLARMYTSSAFCSMHDGELESSASCSFDICCALNVILFCWFKEVRMTLSC